MAKINDYGKLLQLCDYLKCPCVVFLDDEVGIQYFSSVQDLINRIFDDSIYDRIPDFDTYRINFIGVQQSLFDDENLVNVYMI